MPKFAFISTFKYIQNTSDGKGTIQLYGKIGDSIDEKGNIETGISGAAFAAELLYLQNTCSEVSIRINSTGGSVFEAYSIISTILSSKVPCNTYVDGIAASSAGLIAVSGKRCHIMPYGSLMLHNPDGSDDAKLLGIIKDTLVTILSERTAKTPEEISKMMNKETWFSNSRRHADFTLQDGLKAGFFDEIMSIKKFVNQTQLQALKNAESLQEIGKIYNNLNKVTMLKVTNKLGLNDDASEESIVAEIAKKDQKITELENRLSAIEVENAKKEKEAAEAKLAEVKNNAVAFANKAKEEGKISDEEVADMTNLAITNFSLAEKTISMRNPVKKSTKVFDVKNVAKGDSTEDRSSWSFTDWSKKDPNGLAKIQNETPEFFNELVNKMPKNLSPSFKEIPGVTC